METQPKNEMPFCDLVMKGGITSGVIYPKLISKLAKEYRLKNIGGTSAGAIAAAAAAAAEFRRQTKKTDAGFEKLKELPDFLSGKVEGSKQSRLLSLFQPTPNLKRHFKVLLNTLNAESGGLAAVLETVFQMMRYFNLGLLLGLVIATFLLSSTLLGITNDFFLAVCGAFAILMGWGVDTLVVRYLFHGKIEDNRTLFRTIAIWGLIGLVWTIIVVQLFNNVAPSFLLSFLDVGSLTLEILLVGFVTLVATVVYFVHSMIQGLSENGFGFCSGFNAKESTEPEALTNWMSAYFNELTGLDIDEFDRTAPPLTFGQLWSAGSDNPSIDFSVPKNRVINLEVMTSAVSRKMPYRIPFIHDEKEYYFDPVEWERLFPDEVIKALGQNVSSESVYNPKNPKQTLYRLPEAKSLPIVVAVRMSLSFPLLLSAIPLYAIDSTLKSVNDIRKNNRGKEDYEKESIPVSKVWFSDGGISSNMPLHFFDSLLPEHPTFAINLTDKHPNDNLDTSSKLGFESWRVFLANRNDLGLHRHWESSSNLFDFLKSIIMTMQNWRDEIQFPYPGYRDRIVQISLTEKEGGLNLNMQQEAIEALGNAGENAAGQLITQFIENNKEGWDNHRKIRLRNLLAQLELKLNELSVKELYDWQTFLNTEACERPYRMEPQEQKLAEDIFQRLIDIATLLRSNNVKLTKDAPRPVADLHIIPRY